MSHVMKFWTSRVNDADPSTYLGDEARLFFNPDNNTIRLSDGVTPGGIEISGGGGTTVIYSDTTPPATPNGALWYKPSTNTLSVASAGVWFPVDGEISLDDLTDVTITAPAELGEVLWYDGVSQWRNKQINLRGGIANQFLVKLSSADYDYTWMDFVNEFFQLDGATGLMPINLESATLNRRIGLFEMDAEGGLMPVNGIYTDDYWEIDVNSDLMIKDGL